MDKSSDQVSPIFLKRCIREKAFIDGELSAEEYKIIVERDRLEELIELGLSVGMEYQEIMEMDNKRFWVVYRGKMKYLDRINRDTDLLNRKQAVKIQQARFDSDGFNRDSKLFKTKEENTLEKAARIMNADGIPPEVARKNITGR